MQLRCRGKTGELLKTTLALNDETISSVCERYMQKLFHDHYDPSAGRSIDEVRVGHWQDSIQEVAGSRAPASLAAQCYSMWKESRLALLTLSPETRDLLGRLRRSYKLLLLTNGVPQTQREKVRASGCEDFFDKVVVGGEHAEQKPYASIFRLCFDMLEVGPGDCVMVGDSLEADIQGGFNAGVLASVWINGAGGGDVPSGSAQPDFTIPTVLDLPGILDRLECGC